ncbi:glucose 1-dehydrogenase [Williamsia soli]|uniref:glucose 1-dehydrogenase n=1 Tax=Williamsia soli TaxID=364929 RepID=UPI001A9D2B15|nr:glucose 1-dehydrogenase [Williamsia soli]
MGNRLEGKVALITGAARGSGEATARLFVNEGAKVVMTDVLDDLGKAASEELGEAAIYAHLDVTQAEDWDNAVNVATKAFGRFDILVNNAGFARYVPVDKITEEEFMTHLYVNTLGPFLGIRAVIDPMRRSGGGGSIVNIGSTNGLRGSAGGAGYCASKHGLTGLSRSAAVELGPLGIRVNLVAPGGVATQMATEAQAAWYGTGILEPGPGDWSLPLKRMGEPADVATMVLFLASDESSYCSGAEFVVDGGMSADHPTKPAEAWVEHLSALQQQSVRH